MRKSCFCPVLAPCAAPPEDSKRALSEDRRLGCALASISFREGLRRGILPRKFAERYFWPSLFASKSKDQMHSSRQRQGMRELKEIGFRRPADRDKGQIPEEKAGAFPKEKAREFLSSSGPTRHQRPLLAAG